MVGARLGMTTSVMRKATLRWTPTPALCVVSCAGAFLRLGSTCPVSLVLVGRLGTSRSRLESARAWGTPLAFVFPPHPACPRLHVPTLAGAAAGRCAHNESGAEFAAHFSVCVSRVGRISIDVCIVVLGPRLVATPPSSMPSLQRGRLLRPGEVGVRVQAPSGAPYRRAPLQCYSELCFTKTMFDPCRELVAMLMGVARNKAARRQMQRLQRPSCRENLGRMVGDMSRTFARRLVVALAKGPMLDILRAGVVSWF